MPEVLYSFRRVEKKFFITPEEYSDLLPVLLPHLKPDAYPRYTLGNIYYDTDSYELIRRSIEKPFFKEKLRLRCYGTPSDSDRVFVELKKKYDGIVYKRRIALEASRAPLYVSGIFFGEKNQIHREIDRFLKDYRPGPKIFVSYEREAYSCPETPGLRITFDTQIRHREEALDLRKGTDGIPLFTDDRVLMEIKAPEVFPLWLARILSERCIFPHSFSKVGACYRQAIAAQVTAPELIKEVSHYA